MYLGINLTKDMGELYHNYFISLKTEVEEDLRKWKKLLSLLITRVTIVKMTILPKLVYSFMQSPSKFRWHS